jgi:hypothetical protein
VEADDIVRVTGSVAIPTAELEWRFRPSGGLGGQLDLGVEVLHVAVGWSARGHGALRGAGGMVF